MNALNSHYIEASRVLAEKVSVTPIKFLKIYLGGRVMNKQIRLIPALALGMAVLSIPTLATAATTISVVDPAPLVAKGAGALMSVEVTCDPSFGPGSRLFANVSLIQRAGNSTTQGFGGINDTIDCDGVPHTFQILVPFSGRVFHKGSAIAQASETVCNQFFFQCESAQVTEEIQLGK